MGELQNRKVPCMLLLEFSISLRQGDQKERLLEVAVHEGDRLHDDGKLDDGQNARLQDAVAGQGQRHHRRHGQRHAEGLHTGGGASTFPGRAGGGQAQPRRGSPMRQGWNFLRADESLAEGYVPLVDCEVHRSICIPRETGLRRLEELIRQWRGVDDAVLVGLH